VGIAENALALHAQQDACGLLHPLVAAKTAAIAMPVKQPEKLSRHNALSMQKAWMGPEPCQLWSLKGYLRFIDIQAPRYEYRPMNSQSRTAQLSDLQGCSGQTYC